MNENQNLDVIRVIDSVGSVVRFQLIDGQENIRICDSPENSIDVTLCGDFVTQAAFQQGDIIVLKGARVREFKNRKLLTTNCQTRLFTGDTLPDKNFPEWKKINHVRKSMQDRFGRTFERNTNRKSLSDVNAEASLLTGTEQKRFEVRVGIETTIWDELPIVRKFCKKCKQFIQEQTAS
eukprot:TRINITY_DN5799_c0_g1_i2.p1 TRINITY_DN5799_c0_g1~~TRINITY_DN5799_c0_g1_i2.p1  ORF type:complete len:179 (+),score=37.02 TRINITY_DN5799_c0_g1_i2:514-1050(+)